MIRWIARAVGAAFVLAVMWAFGTTLITNLQSPPAPTAEHEFHREPKEVKFASDGPFGKFDKQQLQRGFQVYKEVCSGCHALTRVSFRDLSQLGYEEAEVKAIANQWQVEVPSVNPDTGEPATRKAVPSDHFPSPYANETAARAANNNALPPDLSLMAKAREGGPHYIYSILTGYQNQPAELIKKFPGSKTPPGLHYNPYFANLNFAMPQPLTSEGQVTYAPGNPKPTVDQMAQDVSEFLMWTAEPKLVNRHENGLWVVIFLMFGTVLAYLSYQNIWSGVKGKGAGKGAPAPAPVVEAKARKPRAKKAAA